MSFRHYLILHLVLNYGFVSLTSQTKEFIKEMGQTGAGINRAEDVITSIDSAVTNCWSTSLSAI